METYVKGHKSHTKSGKDIYVRPHKMHVNEHIHEKHKHRLEEEIEGIEAQLHEHKKKARA
jgi:hypothetical protein